MNEGMFNLDSACNQSNTHWESICGGSGQEANCNWIAKTPEAVRWLGTEEAWTKTVEISGIVEIYKSQV